MKGRADSCYVVFIKTCAVVLTVLLVIISNVSVKCQLNNGNTGIPLPIAKEGRTQGQPNKYTVIYEDGENSRPISRSGSPPGPQFGVNLPHLDNKNGPHSPTSGGTIGPELIGAHGGGGPGSLQHIKEPSHDKSVSELINHPVVLKTIQTETRADKAVKVESIIAAHKQVVSGQITYLDLKVVKTRCSIGTRNLATCPVDTSEEPFVCEVAVWVRPWLNNTKVIDEKTKCADVESDNDFKNWNRGHGGLRPMHGEIRSRSIPDYLDKQQVALEAFDYVDRGSESKFKGQMIDYKFGEVKHDPFLNLTLIEVEVEYGFTLCLKFPNRKVDARVCPTDHHRTNYICSVKVISDPKLTTNLKVMPDDDDEDIDCHKKKSVSEELVVPVQTVCSGCPQTISLNDPSLIPMAEFAVIEYDRLSKDDELHKMVKLHKARTQALNGIKYFLTIELADTECRKPLSAVNMNRSLCHVEKYEDTDICEIVVHEQPWQKIREFVSAKCQDSFGSDALIVPSFMDHSPGGAQQPSQGGIWPPTPAGSFSGLSGSNSLSWDALSPELQQSVNFLLSEINLREVEDSDDGLYTILNILRATTMNEPRGQLDTIVLTLGETTCYPGHRPSQNCRLKSDEDHEICTGKVSRPSSPNGGRILTFLQCDDEDEHFHLSVHPDTSPFLLANRPFFTVEPSSVGSPGGPVQQPKDDKTTIEIAHFVVDQFNLQSDEDELYKLGKVLSAFSQLSGNAKYILELVVLETKCKKYQPMMDLSRCPLDHGEDPEICQAEVSISFGNDGISIEKKHLLRMFCDEKEDYYVKKLKNNPNEHRRQLSTSKNVNGGDIQAMGKLIADEFDSRADEDHIFVLSRVLEAKAVGFGLAHHLRVELAETVCPKYKRKIDKSRCVIDIGEEHKICHGQVSERPWRNDRQVTKLHCFERDDSVEEMDESREILYRRVHPSAHARPKFVRSRYRIKQHSQESLESNEKYYRVGGVLQKQQSREDDSHEDRPHHLFRRRSQFDEDDDEDSDGRTDDKDSHSYEQRRFGGDNRSVRRSNEDKFDSPERRRRIRRSRGSGGVSSSSSGPLMFGGKKIVDVNGAKVRQLAEFSVRQMGLDAGEERLLRNEKVLKASKQVVAGILWNIKTRVVFTKCGKNTTDVKLLLCEIDDTKSVLECDMTIYERPWQNFKKLKKSKCQPVH